MASGIYAIWHAGKLAYVGCSIDIRRRINQHQDTLKRKVHRNFLLQRAWEKDQTTFAFTTLEEVDREFHAEREQFYINLLAPWANLSDSRGSHRHTDAAKAKMKKPKSEEHLAKLRAAGAARRGKENGRAGIPTNRVPSSAFQKGLAPWNKDTCGEVVAWNKGLKLSAEHRAALSAAKLGKPRPDVAERLRGKKQPADVVARRLAAYQETIRKRRAGAAKQQD
jgi:group I intron endonuclease